jgi:hypothetical protein
LNGYNKQRVKKLLQYILACAGQDEDFYARALSPIHLIKYVYLADLAHARHHGGQTYTGLPWRFYKFGPWCEEVFRDIEPALNEIGAEQITIQHPKIADDFIKWRVRDDELCDRLDDDLDIAVTGTVQRAVREFGSDTTSLLHYTYKTKPMLMAAPNEPLDFDTVALSQKKPEEEGLATGAQKEQLTDRQKKKRKEKIKAFKEQMRQKPRPEKKRVVPKAPRYDDVFREGVAWLDSLAGEPLKPIEGELIISPEAWRSRARFDPDGIDDDVS